MAIPAGADNWFPFNKYAALQQEKARKLREERRAQRPLVGPGSGREGGGHGASHERSHFQYGFLNPETKREDCPLCLNHPLFRVWMRADYGRGPEWLDQLRPRPPRNRRTKKHRRKKPRPPKPITREYLDRCDQIFDRYMRTHRFGHHWYKIKVSEWWEAKPVYRWDTECDVFISLGCDPEYYDRPLKLRETTHGGPISTKNHIPEQRFDRLLTA